MPGPWSLTRTSSSCGALSTFQREFDLAALRVAEGVADNLGHGGRDARLVLAVEAQQSRRSDGRAGAR